jgi:hypothetical protein
MQLKRLIENWLFSGILTRILIMLKWLRKCLRKLVRLMQYYKIKKSEKYLINMVKKA